MAHHHKSNTAVEGDPGTGHSRGMPERPDEDELERRTRADRREVAADAAARTRKPPEGDIADWTQRLLREAPALAPEQAESFVHDLYFAAQQALDRQAWEADFERDE
jgi:hypothetical protein